MTHLDRRPIAVPLALLVFAAAAAAQVSGQQDARIVPTPNDLEQGDRFGEACDLDGTTLVVGAPWHDPFDTSDAYGRAFVFVRTASGWVQEAELVSSSYDAFDRFGESVAAQGDVAVIGAPYDDESGAAAAGAAYVFAGGAATWTQEVKLSDIGFVFSDQFGTALDLEGERAVVGLPWSDAAGVATGGVRYFERSGGVWSGLFELVGSDCEGGDLVAAGAEWGETPPLGIQTGEAFVFEIVPPPFVASYCTSKPNSLGCLPRMGWSGAPSTSNPNPFWVTCDDVLGFVLGLAFYGTAANSVPFLGGTLCVGGSITRTVAQHSGGNPPSGADCSGSFALDMNAVIQGGQDPALVAGTHVFAQYGSRDPADALSVSLSDALEFEIVP